MKTNIIFKTTEEFKQQLTKEAKEKNLTLSAYIKSILNERKR